MNENTYVMALKQRLEEIQNDIESQKLKVRDLLEDIKEKEEQVEYIIKLLKADGVKLDDENFQYIVTDKQQQTNVKGIYAAGDICGPPWQMAKAVGEGCVAGLSAAKYAKGLR